MPLHPVVEEELRSALHRSLNKAAKEFRRDDGDPQRHASKATAILDALDTGRLNTVSRRALMERRDDLLKSFSRYKKLLARKGVPIDHVPFLRSSRDYLGGRVIVINRALSNSKIKRK
jgi:hypothetical protein